MRVEGPDSTQPRRYALTAAGSASGQIERFPSPVLNDRSRIGQATFAGAFESGSKILAHLPDSGLITKVAGKFPDTFGQFSPLIGEADAVLAYSLIHYIFEHDNVSEFIDRALALLAITQLKILIVVGTRPDTIKMDRVVQALKDCPALRPVVCLTGQHRDMLSGILDFFGIVPDHNLAIMRPK